jgi:hypothetical protein
VSVIKRPVRVWGNGNVVVDPDGNTVCDVQIADPDLERQIAAEIVEALNAVAPAPPVSYRCQRDGDNATFTPGP